MKALEVFKIENKELKDFLKEIYDTLKEWHENKRSPLGLRFESKEAVNLAVMFIMDNNKILYLPKYSDTGSYLKVGKDLLVFDADFMNSIDDVFFLFSCIDDEGRVHYTGVFDEYVVFLTGKLKIGFNLKSSVRFKFLKEALTDIKEDRVIG